MGDLKPIGSEKLQGDDKIKRILELTYFNQKSSNTKQAKVAELVKESANGTYGIVREKDGYYVKKGLNEQSLDYIGGMFMKNKNKFHSYAEALKRLELLKSQELNEEVTKYVLKSNKPKQEAPMPQAPIDDMPPAPAEDVPALDAPADAPADAPVDAEPSAPETEITPEEGKRSDYMAEVQKYAGKLGQELRDQQIKMESDDIKYVLNMVISAVDLDKLDDEDIEEIGKRFDRDEEDFNEPVSDEPAAEEPVGDEAPESAPEDDLAERISKLEELINTKIGSDDEEQALDEFYFFDDEDFENRDKGLEPTPRSADNEKMKPEDDEDKYIEVDITPELGDINESINTTLSKYFE
jgi:hypothetical protein